MNIYGRDLTGRELRRRVGWLGQVAGIEPFVFDDGPARGVRALRFRAGGLSFDVLADRGMDIGLFEYRGVPLAWLSRTGVASPAFYEPAGEGWLRSFGGGLLVTCGLTNVGPPGRRGGEELGLRGRSRTRRPRASPTRLGKAAKAWCSRRAGRCARPPCSGRTWC